MDSHHFCKNFVGFFKSLCSSFILCVSSQLFSSFFFYFPLMFLQLLAFHPSLPLLSSLNVWLSQVHFILVKDLHCPSSSVCEHVTVAFSTTFLLLFFLLFFILCGSAPLLPPPPSICLQHQCFHFLPPPSQPPLAVHFSFCHSSPLVFNLLCLFPPTLTPSASATTFPSLSVLCA